MGVVDVFGPIFNLGGSEFVQLEKDSLASLAHHAILNQITADSIVRETTRRRPNFILGVVGVVDVFGPIFNLGGSEFVQLENPIFD